MKVIDVLDCIKVYKEYSTEDIFDINRAESHLMSYIGTLEWVEKRLFRKDLIHYRDFFWTDFRYYFYNNPSFYKYMEFYESINGKEQSDLKHKEFDKIYFLCAQMLKPIMKDYEQRF
jgi:hypothetical protein